MSVAIPSPILISKKVGQGTIPPLMAATGANDKREVMYQFICQKIKVSMSRPTYVNRVGSLYWAWSYKHEEVVSMENRHENECICRHFNLLVHHHHLDHRCLRHTGTRDHQGVNSVLRCNAISVNTVGWADT
jgi:hypothetical protein